jgi:glucose/arabinose dehydrogenase
VGPGQTPVAAPGLKVNAFATGLKHPRWIHVLPNGDVLVAESSNAAQCRPQECLRLRHGQHDEARRRARGQREPHHAACATPTATAWPKSSEVFLEG